MEKIDLTMMKRMVLLTEKMENLMKTNCWNLMISWNLMKMKMSYWTLKTRMILMISWNLMKMMMSYWILRTLKTSLNQKTRMKSY
jgi:hypothetical protein